MAAVTVFVGFPGHGLAAKGPAETAVGVAAAGEVGDFSALYLNHGDVFVVPAAAFLPVCKDVLAVRAPCKVLVSVRV